MNGFAERLEAHFPKPVRDSIRAPIESAKTLPRAAFIAPDFFALEREAVFWDGWVSVGFGSEVPNPGDIVTRTIAEIPILIARSLEGEVHVLHNVCPRDNCLAVLVKQCSVKEIVGPYHGWRWGLDGKLIDATLYDGVDKIHSFEDGRFDLKPVRYASWQDCLFINLSGSAPDFSEYIAPVADLYATVDLTPLVTAKNQDGYANTTCLEFDANWKTVYDNFAININHEAFVHPMYENAPNVPRVDAIGNRTFEEVSDRGYQGLRFHSEEAAQIYGPMGHEVLTDGAGSLESHTIMSLYPNTNISLFPDHLSISVMFPHSADKTEYLTTVRLIGEIANDVEVGSAYLDGWFSAAEEDAVICAAVQQGRSSPAFDQHPFVPFWERLYHEFSQKVVSDLESKCRAG